MGESVASLLLFVGTPDRPGGIPDKEPYRLSEPLRPQAPPSLLLLAKRRMGISYPYCNWREPDTFLGFHFPWSLFPFSSSELKFLYPIVLFILRD